MSSFVSKAKKAIDKFSMLDGTAVIVALSGGADSVSLLDYLAGLREEYNFTLYAAHLNHMLRGEEADRDERFCKNLCEKYGAELFAKRADVASIAEKQRISTELCGRNLRYEFFEELAGKLNAKIATAHTASDNAETILFNMTRGAGLRGLSGITPVRGNIIRPLIYVTRAEVEEYCAERGLTYVTDSSNLSDDYTRNIIRHHIVPGLKGINPELEGTLSNQSELLRSFNSFLENKAREEIEIARVPSGYSSKKLSELPDALRFSVLHTLLSENSCETDFKTVSLLSDILNGGSLDLNGEMRAVCKQGLLRFVRKEKINTYFSEIELKLNQSFVCNGKEYSVKEIKNDKSAINNSVSELNPVFRTRRAGDVFTLPRRKVTKSLKKLFNELKIPEENRDSLLVLTSGSQVLWIEGIGPSLQAQSADGDGLKILIKEV